MYLFDWAFTVGCLVFVVSVLSPFEPENLFESVAEALKYFVRNEKPFLFTCYFWQNKPGEYAATPCWPESEVLCPPWEKVGRSLHNETAELDRYLPLTGQGVNCRVSAVFEDDAVSQGAAYCVHYRRFGESAFIVAVGSDPNRFEEKNTMRSQSDFLRLSESVGSLVNVRHSLKHFSPHFGSRSPR